MISCTLHDTVLNNISSGDNLFNVLQLVNYEACVIDQGMKNWGCRVILSGKYFTKL